MKALFLVLGFLLAPLLLGASLFLGIFERKKEAADFSLLRYFPAEVYSKHPRFGYLPYVLLAMALLATTAPGVTLLSFMEGLGSSSKAYLSFALALEGLSSCLYFVLASFHPSREKAHLLSYFASVASYMFLNGVYGTLLLAWRETAGSESVPIAGACLFFALMALGLLFLFNPKLRDWYRMEAFSEPDGTVSYRRPRVIYLSLFEWLLLLLRLLSFLLMEGFAAYLIVVS